MKIKVMGLSCALLLAGCTQESAPQKSEVTTVESPAAKSAPQASLKMAAVDPLTAMQVADQGLDIAIKLKTLFGGGKKDETAKRLAEIQKQNTVIISMMTRALSILENLGVTLNKALFERSSTELNTNLRAHLQLVYENWQTELADRRAGSASVAAYRGLLEDVRGITRNFVDDQTYGFAYFQNIGEGMLAELWMSKRVKEREARRVELARPYIEYFERVVDPAIAGSVGAQLKRSSDQATRTGSILAAADASIANGYTSSVTRTTQRGQCHYWYEAIYRAQGNRLAGYTVAQVSNREVKRECEGGHGGGRGINTVPKAMAAADPVDRGDATAQGRVAYWNDVRAVDAKAREESAILGKYHAAAQAYLDTARSILSAS